MKATLEVAQVRQPLINWLGDLSVPPRAALAVVDHVLAAEVLGRRSHGLYLLPGIARKVSISPARSKDVTTAETESGTLAIDAQGLPGIFAMHCAIDEVIRSQRGGRRMVTAGVVGYAGTTGCLGLYCRRLADAGAVGLVMATSQATIAAPGTTRPILGTNPIAFGAPVDGRAAMIGDYASSVWSYGDIALARQRGDRLPDGVVLDAAGRPSVDPADTDHGSMLPSGGHKGFCQALLVEVMAGALAGGKVGRLPGSDSGLIISFRLDAFGAFDAAKASAQLVEQICDAPMIGASGVEVHVPGQRYERLDEVVRTIEVDAITLQLIEDAGGPRLLGA